MLQFRTAENTFGNTHRVKEVASKEGGGVQGDVIDAKGECDLGTRVTLGGKRKKRGVTSKPGKTISPRPIRVKSLGPSGNHSGT